MTHQVSLPETIKLALPEISIGRHIPNPTDGPAAIEDTSENDAVAM